MSIVLSAMALPVRCERCKKSPENVKECSKCVRYLCEECMDEFSGLCKDCTIDLMKGSVEEWFEQYCLGWYEDTSQDAIVCPNCGLEGLVMEENTDETVSRYKCLNCGYEHEPGKKGKAPLDPRPLYEKPEEGDDTIVDIDDELPYDEEGGSSCGDDWSIVQAEEDDDDDSSEYEE